MTRREALRLGLAGTGLAAFPELLGAFPLPQAVEGAGALRIDAHTHIFNARDIAVAGFLRRIGTNTELNPFERFMRWLLFLMIPNKYEDALTALLHMLAVRAAPTVEEEWAARDALKAKMERLNPADPRAAFLEAVAEENRALTADVDDIVGRAMTRLLEKSFTERERNTIVRFMTRMVAMRYQNAGRLFEVYGGQNGMGLFVPAMVDLSLWLDDDTPCPMEEQFKLYAEIARLGGGSLRHLAPFDPWRQAFGARDGADRGEPLRWVRKAVEEYGFAGVKVYPTMGFHPIRNQWHDGDKDYWPRPARRHQGFGAGLDQALGELFAWCESNQVPVLTHANSSMAPRRGYEKRGRPKGWEQVLKLFPNLRLNLGHFGGWDDAAGGDGWNRTIVRLMETYEHVYADVAMFDYIDLPKKRRKLVRGLEKSLREHPVLAERLCYASDWYMANSPEYLADFEAALESPGLEKLREGFFGGNAARLLRLDPK